MSYRDPLETPTGVFTLENLNTYFPIFCCSVSEDNTILATGGFDQKLTLCQWQGFIEGKDPVSEAIHVPCAKDPTAKPDQNMAGSDFAAVVSVDFARKPGQPFVACGCFDGSVKVLKYDTTGGLKADEIGKGSIIQHENNVRAVAWASHENLLASGSADGTIHVHKIVWDGSAEDAQVEKVNTLNLSGSVEALYFYKEKLICYACGTSELLYFDLKKDFKESKINLNQEQDATFAVTDIAAFGDHLALATDASRNIIIEFETGKYVRDLSGHTNDKISQPEMTAKLKDLYNANNYSWFYRPRIAWSLNGQYLYGNTQDEPMIWVWDVATGDIVQQLEGSHSQKIYDMYSSQVTDMLVTTSFDKQTNLWFAPM